MKKKIVANPALLGKFQASEFTSLQGITGGTVVPPDKTVTNQYSTSSSADDADTGDHDQDGA